MINTPGMMGLPGKMSLKKAFVDGDVLDSHNALPSFHFFNAVDSRNG